MQKKVYTFLNAYILLIFHCSGLKFCAIYFYLRLGWSGGAMVLGKLPVPGRPTNLDYSRAGAYLT